MKFAAALLVLLPLVAGALLPQRTNEANGENWFLLVAGSSGFGNYRHQSDICHAYQIMHGQGIPDDHIVVMMFDDIADNFQNPHPGKIYNHPDLTDDVYAGVPKDYTGSEVTVANFFKILKGDAEGLKSTGSGKVIKSGPNDRVFINFSDHGAPGIFAFPYENLAADDLAEAIKEMHANGQYKEMVMYMESCESGSMFEGLYPDDISFYALSASNPTESSWACYCGTEMGTCLGDLFSCNWMEDTDNNDPATETLNEQFENTKRLTTASEVMQWGDTTIDQETVGTFFSAQSNKGKTHQQQNKDTLIQSQDVPVFLLEQKLRSAKTVAERKSLTEEIAALKLKRVFVKETMKKIALAVTADEKLAQEMMEDKHSKITKWGCYRPAVQAFHDKCFNVGQSTYALTVLHTLLDLCEAGFNGNNINIAINDVCTFPTVYDAV